MLLCQCFGGIIVFAFMVSTKKVVNRNLALRKPTRQSSTFLDSNSFGGDLFTANSSLAVDSNTSPVHKDKSCMHTRSRPKLQWWEVDLEQNYWIEQINIMSRTDFRYSFLATFGRKMDFSDRLHDLRFDVYLEKTEPRKKRHCTTYVGPPASPGWVNITCDTAVTGRYVRISKKYSHKDDFLNMCEVEIYGATDEHNFEMEMTVQPFVNVPMEYRNCCAICN